MTSFDAPITTVSTKGQVILPKPVRDHQHWSPGTRLTVEITADGVLLKAAPHFAATTPAEVYGSLPKPVAPKTLNEMRAGIAAEARRRHTRVAGTPDESD